MAKRLTDKIKELERKHKVIADNLLDAIWVIDAETLKYDYITPSIEKISGYTAHEFMQFDIQDRLVPESFQAAVSVLAEEMPRFDQGVKIIRTMEVELNHKNGDSYWAEIRARFIKEAGKSLKIVGMTREITDYKKNEQKKSELIQKLEKALAEKERLLQEVKVLKGLLPICSGCKRIRDEKGKWWPLDVYVKSRTDAELTHTICPGCTEVMYSDL